MADAPQLAAQLDAAVIHDLKNRLAILAGELARLNELDLPPEARRHALAAQEQADAVTHKLVAYLTLRRAAAPDGLRANTQEDTPALLLDELQAEALLLAGGRVEVLVDAAGAPDFWFYDRHLVLLALDSALYNALRFARSRITLRASTTAGGICFSIRDDGPGVQATPDASSTGVGLRVCEAVAAAHRNRGIPGHCTLRSERDGGAVFELHLP